MIAGLSGLCTLLLAATSLLGTDRIYMSDFTAMLAAVAVFGGIPIALGAGMALLGRYLIKTGREQ